VSGGQEGTYGRGGGGVCVYFARRGDCVIGIRISVSRIRSVGLILSRKFCLMEGVYSAPEGGMIYRMFPNYCRNILFALHGFPNSNLEPLCIADQIYGEVGIA
jgi:hypothetical protein